MRAVTMRHLATHPRPSCSSRHASQAQTVYRTNTMCIDQSNRWNARASAACGSTSSSSASSSSSVLPPELADYRPNVGVCLVNKQGLVFAATRVDDPAKSWQMPQGGIDPGEDPLTAAVRELQEETSISSVQLLAEAPRWLHYDFPPEVRARLSSYWARYKGQAQRWFLFKFTGDDSEVDLATSHREFSEWRWMPLQQLPGSVVPFKRPVYEAVLAELAPAVEALKAEARQQ